jgi:hypothetical protein
MIKLDTTKQTTLLDFTMYVQGKNLKLAELKEVLNLLGISGGSNDR